MSLDKIIADRLTMLKSVRLPYEALVDESIRFVAPGRKGVAEINKGDKIGKDVYDGTAPTALQILTDGIAGYLCSKNMRWFSLTLPTAVNFSPDFRGKLSDLPEVRSWLQDCEEEMYYALAESNFYEQIVELIRDGASLGTANMLIEEDVASGKLVFTIPHFRECYIAENHRHSVDTLFREYYVTNKQLADKFGKEKVVSCDSKFDNDLTKTPYADRKIIHAMYPENGKILSVWVLPEADKDKLLGQFSYNSLPFVSWRWRKESDETYGRCPAMDALIMIHMANQMGKGNIKTGQRMSDPPMVGMADLRGLIKNNPGGWTFLSQNMNLEMHMPKQLYTNLQLPYGLEIQDRQDKVIREAFCVEFFLALTQAAANNTELTATQVMEMMGEKAVILGTRIGFFQSQGLDPAIERIFAIEGRAGRLPKIPQIVLDSYRGYPKIQYIGPLSQVQLQLSKSRTMNAGLQQIAQVAQLDPTALDVIDSDEVVREIVKNYGIPQSLLRSQEMINAIRTQRSQQQQKQQDIENLDHVAKATRAGVATPQPGSPMQALMNPEAFAANQGV